jgi:hypothetical protein
VRSLVAIAVLLVACGASTTEEVAERTLPDPLFSHELPDPPAKVAPEKAMSVAATECVAEGSDPPQKLPAGILISLETAAGAARTKIAYDEMRQLYKTDLATMDRERAIYEEQLEAADREVEVWRGRSERTWLERNGGMLGLAIGFVAGAAITVAIVAAIDGVTEGVP